MWCTRWFLVLVLLPLPTAPPYFLAVFLVSMFLHARPCFYCMMILSALFTSSCYWHALPMDAPLTRQLGNATTFGEALRTNLSVPDPSAVEFPSYLQLSDRCWCNLFSKNGLFKPTNVSLWELESIERMRREIEAKAARKAEERKGREDGKGEDEVVVEFASGKPEVMSESDDVAGPPSFSFRGLRDLLFPKATPSNGKYRLKPGAAPSSAISSTPEAEPSVPPGTRLSSEDRQKPVDGDSHDCEEPPLRTQPAKFLRPYYDLRPYGLDITVDFRWNRPQER